MMYQHTRIACCVLWHKMSDRLLRLLAQIAFNLQQSCPVDDGAPNLQVPNNRMSVSFGQNSHTHAMRWMLNLMPT